MMRRTIIVALVSLVVLTSCGPRASTLVEDIGGAHDVSRFNLKSIKGTRDGDRLDVRALYGDDSGALTLNLQFKVTPPTRLENGTWVGLATEGSVKERSVTFLGGQSGPPSIGGRFDLIGSDNRPLYRVTIPLQELKEPL